MKWDLPYTVITGIYKITNELNGKYYIGQAEDIYQRFRTHFWAHGDHHNSAIDAAIHKYGLENFTLDILEECPKELLNEREIYWGEQYFKGKCYVPDGYNIALLGNNQQTIFTCQEVSQYNLDGKLLQTYISYAAAGRAMSISSMAIRQAALRKGTSKGFMWAIGHEPTIEPFQQKISGNKVYAYNKKREIELEFKNQTDAARYFDISPTAIMYYLNHKIGYVCCKGYFLARENEEPVIRERLKNIQPENGRKIYQYDLNNKNFIKCFNTIKSAAEELKCDTKGLRNAARGIQNQSQGYIWSFKKYDRIPDNYRQLNIDFINSLNIKEDTPNE